MQPTQITQSGKTKPEPSVSGSTLRNDFERIAQHMYTQNLTLVQTNRTLSVLRAIDLLTLESSRNLQQLGADIGRAVLSSTPYALVAVFSPNQRSDQTLSFQGHFISQLPSQKSPGESAKALLEQFRISLDSVWLSQKKGSLTIDLANLNSTPTAQLFGKDYTKLFLDIAEAFSLRSIYITRLRARDSLTGFMLVGMPDVLPKIDDIELIERISEPAGIAIDNRLLFEENQRVIKQLQQTNDKLKEIDATKDEFISMASHQLRTPLTSVKGYVSMVLDGEAGDVNETQHKMLQQAFDSSQRMVYLIADLLNVSRLRTGKFIIENKITDLPSVITSELKQLEASAAARKIKFTYKQTPDFPKVILDETKIRQVIMNFLDNGMYYTPEGGRVTVELAADATFVQCTITDTGVGVPKAEQPFLFTKFYRAQNARRMRPDGTGLGLYMAKKVIIAQGGVIIFKSVEGQGSTFGFKFTLDKIKVPASGS